MVKKKAPKKLSKFVMYCEVMSISVALLGMSVLAASMIFGFNFNNTVMEVSIGGSCSLILVSSVLKSII